MADLIKCKKCGKEIRAYQRCGYCGNDQRIFFVKYKVVTGLLILAFIIGILGTSGTSEPKKTVDNTTTSVNDNIERKIYNVGDIIETGNFKITVNKAYVLSESSGLKPEEDSEFLAVDCTIENTSKTEQNVQSMFMFSVAGYDGTKYEYLLPKQIYANIPQLDGNIRSGEKMTGVYLVEIPKGQTGLEFQFHGSLSAGSHISVKLN